jgi:hypothetical protein
MALAAWRLMTRADLDREGSPEEKHRPRRAPDAAEPDDA